MTVDRIKVSKEFMGEWISMESPVGEREDPIQCYLELKNTIMNAYNSLDNPPSWFSQSNHFSSNPQPKVINRLYDDIRDKIKECKTKDELIAYKNGELKNNIPGDVMSDFVNRLQELKVHG